MSLSKDELLAVLGVALAASERDWLMIAVTYNHALRRSETVALTRDDLQDGMIDVRRLKGSEHTIQPLVVHDNPLLNERDALLAFVAKMHGNQKVFPICDRQLARVFKRHALAAGVPRHKAHIHALKHTCVTQVLKNGGINYAQRWAGHKSGASTLMYTKLSDEEAAPVALAALRC